MAQPAGRPTMLSGYAIVWNVVSDDRGGFKVRLMPGSARFAQVVHALKDHDYGKVLGDNFTSTLRIAPDGYGVKVEIDLPDTTDGRDTAELVRTRRVRGMSFGMVETPWAWDRDINPVSVPGKATVVVEDGQTIINVEDFLCDEVTVTPIPAYSQAVIGVGNNPPRPTIGYAARTSQALQLEQARFDQLRLAVAETHGRAV